MAKTKEVNGDEPRHPIQVVARRTGISADLIRMWEKRYRVVRPGRTSGGRRAYTDADVEKLRLLREATLGGRRISDVAGLSTPELRAMILEDVTTTAVRPPSPAGPGSLEPAALIQDCLTAVRSMDAERLQVLVMRTLSSFSLDALVEDLLAPLFRRIGEEWEAGRLEVFQEHLATSVTRTVLMHILSTQRSGGHAIVLSTPSGQSHEIGLMFAAMVAASAGWRVVYLGPDLPAEEIAKAARLGRARVVAISLVASDESPELETELLRLGDLLPAESILVVGGAGREAQREALTRIGAVTVSDVREFREVLDRTAAQTNRS